MHEFLTSPRRLTQACALLTLALSFVAIAPQTAGVANDAYAPDGAPSGRAADAYRPAADDGSAPPPADETYRPEAPPAPESYEPVRPRGGNSGAYRPLDGSRRDSYRAPPGGYGAPYRAPETQGREEHYEPVPPAADGGPVEPGGRGA